MALCLSLTGFSQSKIYENWPSQAVGRSLTLFTFRSDSLFNDPQMISILQMDKEALEWYRVDLAYSDSTLVTTSGLARSQNAAAAINGSYFDMKNGGSVTYMEIDGRMIDTTRNARRSHINGAVIIGHNGRLVVEPARSDEAYARSEDEEDVLVSGPLLISNGVPENLPATAFVTTRHPRTCLCITPEAILFITIDGRRETAAGMDLHDVQAFLISLGCVDAVNMDGGGSTTMWIHGVNGGRIVNHPSDRTGERPVANALVIIRRIR
jgi:exopolysaccharide biosynthesis protein